MTLSFHSLLCHSNLALAIQCFSSFFRHGGEHVSLVIHDDGTLTDSDAETLETRLPRVRIVRRMDADERMNEELRRHPVCAKFRRETCMALKLLDAVTYSEGSVFRYTDADVYYTRSPAGLYLPPMAGTNAVFMHDFESTYSVRSWDFIRARQLRLVQKVNAGLVCLNRASHDLDFLEWFLADPLHQGNPHKWVWEQTAWAALGARVGCRLWSNRNVPLGTIGLNPVTTHHAIHFVGMFRHRMQDYVDRAEAMKHEFESETSIPETVPAKACRPRHIFFTELSRVSQRAVSKVRGKFPRRETNRIAVVPPSGTSKAVSGGDVSSISIQSKQA